MSQQKAITILDKDISDEEKKHIAYKNFIVLFVSSLCVSVSLGINQLFLYYLESYPSDKKTKTLVYVITLILTILVLAYFLRLDIDR